MKITVWIIILHIIDEEFCRKIVFINYSAEKLCSWIIFQKNCVHELFCRKYYAHVNFHVRYCAHLYSFLQNILRIGFFCKKKMLIFWRIKFTNIFLLKCNSFLQDNLGIFFFWKIYHAGFFFLQKKNSFFYSIPFEKKNSSEMQ